MSTVLLLTDDIEPLLKHLPEEKALNYVKHQYSPTFKLIFKNYKYDVVIADEYLDSEFDKIFIYLSESCDYHTKIARLLDIAKKYTHKHNILFIDDTKDLNVMEHLNNLDVRSCRLSNPIVEIIDKEMNKYRRYELLVTGSDTLYEKFIKSMKYDVNKFDDHDVVIFNCGNYIYNLHLCRHAEERNMTDYHIQLIDKDTATCMRLADNTYTLRRNGLDRVIVYLIDDEKSMNIVDIVDIDSELFTCNSISRGCDYILMHLVPILHFKT